MAEIERRIDCIAQRQDGADGIAEKMRRGDIPMAVIGRELEQPFAGPDIEPLWHPLS
jgi:hypothetical protein